MSQLLQAAAHQWGEGKVHLLTDDGSKTLCGKTRDQCRGQIVKNLELNCLICQRSVETQRRHAEFQQHYEEQAQERQRQQEEINRQWWETYNQYLETREWRDRRARVLKRAQGRCEGCGKAHATQVHHLTYERVTREMLFDLVAICDDCHQQLHRDKALR